MPPREPEQRQVLTGPAYRNLNSRNEVGPGNLPHPTEIIDGFGLEPPFYHLCPTSFFSRDA